LSGFEVDGGVVSTVSSLEQASKNDSPKNAKATVGHTFLRKSLR
jgi:hypothetical protein